MQDVYFLSQQRKKKDLKKNRQISLVHFCKLFKLIYSAVSTHTHAHTHTHCEVVFLFLLSARRKVNASES